MFGWQVIFVFFFKAHFFKGFDRHNVWTVWKFGISWGKNKDGDDSVIKEHLLFYKQASYFDVLFILAISKNGLKVTLMESLLIN